MGIIGVVLLVILIISSLLLVLVVLVQDDQGEGIGGIFGGGSNTAFGSRSGNVLTRFTAALAAVFLFCCFGLAWINRTPTAGDVVSKARQAALNGTTRARGYWMSEDFPPFYSRPVKKGMPDGRWVALSTSADFETDILEGATMVRIGQAILGPRPSGDRLDP